MINKKMNIVFYPSLCSFLGLTFIFIYATISLANFETLKINDDQCTIYTNGTGCTIVSEDQTIFTDPCLFDVDQPISDVSCHQNIPLQYYSESTGIRVFKILNLVIIIILLLVSVFVPCCIVKLEKN